MTRRRAACGSHRTACSTGGMQPAARDPIYTRNTKAAARSTRHARCNAQRDRAPRSADDARHGDREHLHQLLPAPPGGRPASHRLQDVRAAGPVPGGWVPCEYPAAPCDTVAVRCIVCRHCAYVRRRVLARFASALWGLETVRSSRQLIGTVIGVLLNGIIPEWAITLPLFIMLALMTVQTTAKG